MQELKIEYLTLDKLKPYDKNARKHQEADLSTIKASITEFGMSDPIGVWGKDNVIVEGHGRYLACKDLGIEQVPVIHLDHLTDEQRKAYALAHNKTAEMSEWDFNILGEELEGIFDIDMTDFGFDEAVTDEDYGTDFTLADGDKSEICKITFIFHEKQKELIEYAMSVVKDDITETFGNENKRGNQIYEVVRQWAEQRK